MIEKARRHFMLLMASVTTMIIAAALIAIYLLTYSNLESVNRSRLMAAVESRITDDGTVQLEDGEREAVVVEHITSAIGVFFSIFTDQSGQLLAAYSMTTEQSLEEYQTAADISLRGKNYGKVKLFGRFWQYAVYLDNDVNVSFVEMSQMQKNYGEVKYIRFVDITESREMLMSLAVTLTIIGLVLFLLLLLCSAYFSKRAIRPLAEALEKQRQFIADASHELKTPVSIIKTNLSVLRANEDQTVAQQIEWLNNIETGANRMKKLIQSLISLVRIEGSDSEIALSEVFPDKEIKESLDAFRLMIEDKRLSVEQSYGHDIRIISDAERVRQVIDILLDNAIKYADVGGTIQIIISREKKWTCLSILNTGKGIEKENLGKVFDRFYREESARSHDGSHGLGLSIAAETIRGMGGTISVESVVNENTVFTVKFPWA